MTDPTSTSTRAAALPLLAGLVTQAGTTYLVLVLAGRSLGPVGFAALSSLYLPVSYTHLTLPTIYSV